MDKVLRIFRCYSIKMAWHSTDPVQSMVLSNITLARDPRTCCHRQSLNVKLIIIGCSNNKNGRGLLKS